MLATVQRRRRNLIVVHEGEDLPVLAKARRMDIWWAGNPRNLGLMLALAFLLRKHPVWAAAETVVWCSVDTEEQVAPTTKKVKEILKGARFAAEVRVVQKEGDAFATIRQHSLEADLLFMGLRARAADESLEDYAAYYALLCEQTDGLPPTVLVTAAEDVDLHRLFA